MKRWKKVPKAIGIVLASVIFILLIAALVLLLYPAPVTTSDSFSMEVLPDSVTPTGASFLVTNNLDSMPSFGTDFHIEKKGLFGWRKLVPQNLIQYSLATAHFLWPRSEASIPKDWTHLYGPLSRGTYRLVMEFTNMETRESCYLGAEFTLP